MTIYRLLPLLFFLLVSCQQEAKKNVEYISNSGKTQGTFYSIVYLQPEGKDLQPAIEAVLKEFDQSLSTYNPSSLISRINQNDDSVVTDDYFESMYAEALKVSELTHGAFDITVAPLVKAWGFGFGSKDKKEIPDVQSILPLVGYQKVKLENKRIIKSDPQIMLDANAIAQGQSADVVAKLLEENGCEHYMVEIGGEIACKGKNPKGKKWQIGIDKPKDESVDMEHELQTVVAISNVGLATSGNYRQFYFKDGKKYAHTINPVTGYPVDHNLLSATVVAPTCIQADAFATAFMVMGVDSSLAICNRIPDMECYLIYADKKGIFQVKQTDGFKKYLVE